MKVAHPFSTINSASGNTSPCPIALAAKIVRSRHVARYFPSGSVDGIGLNRRLPSLLDQKPVTVLCACNPMRRLAAAAP
ncbi:hypothetical protein SB778_34995, partial [Paraburkholderia sp. SIMBA_050]